MRLIKARVQNYRSVKDTGYFDVENLKTILVGPNGCTWLGFLLSVAFAASGLLCGCDREMRSIGFDNGELHVIPDLPCVGEDSSCEQGNLLGLLYNPRIMAATGRSLPRWHKRVTLVGTPSTNPHLLRAFKDLGLHDDIALPSIRGSKGFPLGKNLLCGQIHDSDRCVTLYMTSDLLSFDEHNEGLPLPDPEPNTLYVLSLDRSLLHSVHIPDTRAAGFVRSWVMPDRKSYSGYKRAIATIKSALGACGARAINNSDYAFLASFLDGKEVVFLGECRHYDSIINESVLNVALALRRVGFASTYATEAGSQFSPFTEGESLYDSIPSLSQCPPQERPPWEVETTTSGLIPLRVATYNQGVPLRKRLRVSTLDLVHSITLTSRLQCIKAFVQEAIGACNCERGHDIFSALDLKAESREDYRLVEAEIDDAITFLQSCRCPASKGKVTKAQFAAYLLKQSLAYGNPAWRSEPLTTRGYIEFEEIRASFLRFSIERLWEETKARGGALLCHTGGAHAVKAYRQAFSVGKWAEAYYFNSVHEDTQGKVASIYFHRVDATLQDQGRPSSLHDIVSTEFAGAQAVFVPLGSFRKELGDLGVWWCKYYHDDQPLYDAVIFLLRSSPTGS